MKKIELSIIVPVYNAEATLCATVNSIFASGLDVSEYEILLINDGSSDASQQICDDLQQMHSNIRCFSQRNQGVSSARNLGIREALGQYIGFVDSDDLLVSNGLKFLFDNFSVENYDVVRFWTSIVYAGNKGSENPTGRITFEGDGWSFVEKFGLDTFCYGSIYRKEWLQSKGILFEPGLTMGEDFLFCSQVLLYNPHILSTSCRIYNYIIREGSATTNRSHQHIRRSIESQLISIERVYTLLDKIHLKEKNVGGYQKSIESIQSRFSHLFSRLLLSDYSRLEYKRVCNMLANYSLLPIKLVSDNRINKNAAFINLLYHSPFFFPFYRFCYSCIFYRYIYPKLNRLK